MLKQLKKKTKKKKVVIGVTLIEIFLFELFSRIIIGSFLWISCGGIILFAIIISEFIYIFLIVFHYKNIIYKNKIEYMYQIDKYAQYYARNDKL